MTSAIHQQMMHHPIVGFDGLELDPNNPEKTMRFLIIEIEKRSNKQQKMEILYG